MLKHSVITYFYQFSAEAIIAFLLIFPFIYNHYDPRHYGGFIIVTVVTAVVFFLLETVNRHAMLFLVTIPISTYLFFLFSFPIGLAVLFPLIFVWRYASVRTYKTKEQEGLHLHLLDKRSERNKAVIYLQVTVILAVIDFIFTREIVVFIYLLLQFITLLIGYLLSHMVELDKKERKRVGLKSFVLIPVCMVMGSFIVYFIYNPFLAVISQVWVVIKSIIIFLISNVALILDSILPNNEKASISEELQEMMENMRGNQQNSTTLPGNPIMDEATLKIIIISIIFLVIALFIVRSFKKTRAQFEVNNQTVTYHSLHEKKNKKEGLVKRYGKKLARSPSDPVRNLIYKFERIAAKSNRGRYNFESVEEWFERLQVEVNVATYQKVRYGDLKVSDQEIYELEQQLKRVENFLRTNK